jgi:hypothetical protein
MKKVEPKQDGQGEQVIPDDLVALIQQRDGAARLLKVLPQRFSCADVADTTLRPGPGSAHNAWESCGYTYLASGRVHEAIAVFQGLYDHLLTYQEQTGKRAHKGSPLVFLSDSYLRLNQPVVARHFLMLALCEDAIQNKGVVRPETTGVYFRAVWQFGLSDKQVREYTSSSWNLFKKNRRAGVFPEWLLQELDQRAKRKGVEEWMTGYPSPAETTVYAVNRHYINWLLKGIGKSGGKNLERLAHYLISAMPGCRARMGMRSPSTEYDVLGLLEGHFVDFRADLGRYILCECKDWKKKANFTAIAKFSRVVESTKATCGIIFSREGITGEGTTRYAERELLKLFQGHGIAILVVRLQDLQDVANGRDFIEILRSKYEAVRLDLSPSAKRKVAKKK